MKEKCVICGKPAKYISYKFISPLCEECAEKEAKKIGEARGLKFVELEDFYTEPCEEMNDIVKTMSVEEVVG